MVSVFLMASELSRNRKRPPDNFYTHFVMSAGRAAERRRTRCLGFFTKVKLEDYLI